MPAPARKSTAPRKSAPRKPANPAAVAARKEAAARATGKGAVTVPFKGDKFTITLDHLASGRVQGFSTLAGKFQTVDNLVNLVYEILGPVDSARFINLFGEGDEISSACVDFMIAVNKAAKVPNS